MKAYTIGLDYGTNSARAVVVNTATGEELAASIWNYESGDAGIITSSGNPDLARQNPADYVKGIENTVRGALKEASRKKGFSASRVIGIGVDTTGSTPIPVDAEGVPLAYNPAFAKNPNAMAWLWKDHTGHSEAAAITATALRMRPHYLVKCGGTYSSEWFWSKIWHCTKIDPAVAEAAYTWVECADWIPAVLTGTTHPDRLKRCICAAGHKAMFNKAWDGYPDEKFLRALDSRLVRIGKRLPSTAFHIGKAVGGLTSEWAKRLGLQAGIPVAAGAFDAHLGAVGSGIRPGALVKIIGTSTCDIAVSPLSDKLADIPGLCGIVPESVLPGYYGLEAGQSAVGDIFNWFVTRIAPGGAKVGSHEALTKEAEKLHPGESGLLALDWNNGNRTILVDQRLTGLIMGLTLHSTPAEIYRALVEATAFGARVIVERFSEYGVKINRVINCGGIAVKNPLIMQIYADVLNRPIEISRSSQTCALGAAMAGAVVAGKKNGGHDSFASAAKAMTGVLSKKFKPVRANAKVYENLYGLYRSVHDAFGINKPMKSQYTVMKSLLSIRDKARSV